MSAVAPSHEEQTRIDAFGLFDTDVTTELEDRDVARCALSVCDADATHAAVLVPCRHSTLLCGEHAVQLRDACDTEALCCRRCEDPIYRVEVTPV
jgi:hypothetical protein